MNVWILFMIDRKFIEILHTDEWEVLTPDGYKNFDGIGKTIPYKIYHLILDDGKEIKCADTHIVMCDGKEVYVKNLNIDDYVDTIDGHSKVKNIIISTEHDNMYDLTNVDGEVYYTNNIVSHNTTALAAYIIWAAVFNSDKFIGIASNKAVSARDFLSRVQLIYEELPVWLKPGCTVYNVYSMELDNGTRIEVSATTKNAFRGRSMWILCLDELAHVSSTMSSEFWNSNYHAITASQEAKIIVLSTPNGLFNLFWQLYTDAERGVNSFNHLEVPYNRVPGRDEAWKIEQLKNMSAEQFSQEQNIEFLGSSSTVINSDVLKNLMIGYKDPIAKELEGKLLVYEKPIPGNIYIIGADVAKGTGQNFSAAQVLKVKSLKPIRLEQVAAYNCNTVDIYKFSEILIKIGYYYNTAYLLIENNAEGAGVVNRVWWDLEYMNMYSSGGKNKDLGIRATKTTKPRSILLMKKLLEDYSLSLVDKTTIDQLADFSEQNGKFGCTNLNDDLVSALYWACHILNTEWLPETFEFSNNNNDGDDVWGVLTDVEPAEDWSWLNDRSMFL
jgi:hypothetical protein